MNGVSESLPAYLQAVEDRIRVLLAAAPLHPRQKAVLAPLACDDGWRTAPLRHALAPFYFLIRAHGSQVDAAALRMGTGLLLTQRCMCLIDDVEDDELAGSAADVGSVLAINAGLTLFLLGVDELLAAQDEIGHEARAARLWRSFYVHALRLSRAQHDDISGRGRLRSAADAAHLAAEKSAFCCVLAECAGVHASPRRLAGSDLGPHRRLGDALAGMQQIVDDVSDLFGPEKSADVRTRTCNVPLAALLEVLPDDDRARWSELLRDPTALDQRALGQALYDSGAMTKIATMLEAERERIHRAVVEIASDATYAAILLAWVDDLAALVYCPTATFDSPDIERVEPQGLAGPDLELFERLRLARAATNRKIAAGA